MFDCFDQLHWQWRWLLFTSPGLMVRCWWSVFGHIKSSACIPNIIIMLPKFGGCNIRVDYSLHWIKQKKNEHHHQSLKSDEQIQWTFLANIISGRKKKCGSFFIEICCEFVKENIGTKFATFCEGKYLLRSPQSQSKFLSKCSDPKYLHVHLKHFWRSTKVQTAQSNLCLFSCLSSNKIL